MTILTTAATAYLASYRLPSIRFLTRATMASSPSPAAKAAAAARIRHLSSSSSLMNSSPSSTDINGNGSRNFGIPSNAKPIHPPKRVLLLRHGQAQHNPRAEVARENGCSFDEFLRLMEEDDAFDAALTELGENQAVDAGRQPHVRNALRNVEMVVSSPLSRALKTADLVHPSASSDATTESQKIDSLPRRVCVEHFREINGMLLNAQRRPRSDLEQSFPNWCFKQIPSADESWGPELESKEACSERGYRGLLWVMQQQEDNVMVVCHGGLLNYTMNIHPNMVLVDERKEVKGSEEQRRCITKRFGNCELREFIMTVWNSDDYLTGGKLEERGVESNDENKNMEPVITLEEVSMHIEESRAWNDDDDSEEKVQTM